VIESGQQGIPGAPSFGPLLLLGRPDTIRPDDHNGSGRTTESSYHSTEAFRHTGGKIIATVPFTGGSVPKIPAAALKSDAIYLAAQTALNAQPIIKALRDAGFRGAIVGGDGYDAPSAWAGTPLARDVWYTTHAFPAHTKGSSSATTTAAFLTAYTMATGKPANAFVRPGRDTALLLATVVHQAHFEKRPLVSVLSATRNFIGVTGAICYRDGSRVPVKPVALVSARNTQDQPVQIIPS